LTNFLKKYIIKELTKVVSSLTSKRGVSPVIATVILVALAITVAVATAYWMGDISSQYTLFEKADISSISYEENSGNPNNTMVATFRSTGTVLLNISEILINDQTKSFNVTEGTMPLEPGEECTLTIMDVGWQSGKEYSLEIQTKNGNVYIKMSQPP